jgi:hypothetical protein
VVRTSKVEVAKGAKISVNPDLRGMAHLSTRV